jgi:glycerol-3-phosphate O-acyltransferase
LTLLKQDPKNNKPNIPPNVKRVYEPILPGSNEWPVVRLARNRKEFIEEVTDEALDKIKKQTGNTAALLDEIELTAFRERLRIKQNPWLVDPDDELPFWNKTRSKLIQITRAEDDQVSETEHLARDIVSRYSNEIAGSFKPSSYRFARTVATFGFSRLLNASKLGFKNLFKNQYTLQDKINIVGETDQLRKLAKKGTIVMVPTHFSNLDSILIGWVIHTLGLPPFIYGAGLNLFNISLFAYFMNSLGAYKVDRRKKNYLYLETLKAYSRHAIRNGCHSLFFPGGTRSRSGMIERKLKLGLLGSAMEAQREIYQKNESKDAEKIFVFPVVLNYHFVLEAPGLINEWLKQEGQERYYVEKDDYTTSYKIFKFLLKFFTKGSDISVSIGKGMDILGNYVDDDGNSLDKNGKIIDTREYFLSQGKVVEDKQRETEYTEMLGRKVVKEFHRINRVFSSHLVAFTAFQLIQKKHARLDLFSLLRLPEEDLVIPYSEFIETLSGYREKLFKLYNEGKLDLAPHMVEDLDKVIEHGISNLGMYHAKRPLARQADGDLVSEDLTLLFFYHNRMDGYGLEKI